MATTGYRLVYAPGHPLVPPGGSPVLPEHRIILYAKIGPGLQACYRCGAEIAWMPGAGNAPGAVITDHIDRDRANNDPVNLEPACVGCSLANRSNSIRPDECTVDNGGHQIRGVRRICPICDGDFVVRPYKNPRRGVYCSNSCATRGRHRGGHVTTPAVV